MRIRWFGQSSFLIEAEQKVMIDPFGDMSGAAARGFTFDYPPFETDADLLLVTHEHADHNGVEAVRGTPSVIRSSAGTFESPVGEVVGIASEHDDVAGTARGSNVIYSFTVEGVRVCHLGDLGQRELRPEQLAALQGIDVLFIPVGGHATIDGATAAAVVASIGPSIVIPMHYRTPAINFLEPADSFLASVALPVDDVGSTELSVDSARRGRPAHVAVLAPPA